MVDVDQSAFAYSKDNGQLVALDAGWLPLHDAVRPSIDNFFVLPRPRHIAAYYWILQINTSRIR